MHVARPSTIEKAIKNMEERIRLVQLGGRPPLGYLKSEWIAEASGHLAVLKRLRLESPVG